MHAIAAATIPGDVSELRVRVTADDDDISTLSVLNAVLQGQGEKEAS